MANEPERPIEKLLRAIAKQRRDDAGAPFELHPATRRLLQGEVARRRARPPRESGLLAQVLGRLWPRFAWSLAIFAVLGVVVWVLLPAPGRGRPDALLAKNEPASEARQAQAPLPPPPAAAAKTPPPASAAPEAYAVSIAAADKAQAATRSPARRLATEREEFASDSLGTSLNRAVGDNPALAAAAQSADRQKAKEMPTAVLSEHLAQAPAGTVSRDYQPRYGLAGTPALSASSTVVPAAPAPAATPPPATKGMMANEWGTRVDGATGAYALVFKSLAVTNSARFSQSAPLTAGTLFKPADGSQKEAKSFGATQQFARLAQSTKTKSSPADQSAPAQSVLASFRVEQAGTALRVVDGDGSVYSGYLELPGAADRARSIKAEVAASGRAAPARGGVLEERAIATRDSDGATPHAYYFRVAGTNRSLNKKVVFTGNLLASTNLNTVGSLGGFQNAPAQRGSRLLLNTRISGQAVVGSGKAVEINAFPTSP